MTKPGHPSTWKEFPGSEALPAERRSVLVKIAADPPHSSAVAVGYLRYAAGDRDCPYFVVHGFGRAFIVTHWSDSLGDDFHAPGWVFGQERSAW